MVDRNGKTALHLACERGDMDIVNILTQFLINTHGQDSWEVNVMLNARDYQGKKAFVVYFFVTHLQEMNLYPVCISK